MHHWCRWHWWQMEKKYFNHKSFNYFVWTPLGSRVNLWIHFAFKFTLRSQQPDIVPYLPSVLLISVANLAPVTLIPVVHLGLEISPRIFKKIWNSPKEILWGWGETDSWKKTRGKQSRDTVPLSSKLLKKEREGLRRGGGSGRLRQESGGRRNSCN